MNIFSLSQYSASILPIHTHFFDSIKFQHKKIALIVAFILGGLAACYLLCRPCFSKDKKIARTTQDNQQLTESLLPDFLQEQKEKLQLFFSNVTLVQDALDRHKQQEKDLNDLTGYTKQELEQLLANANPNVCKRELNDVESTQHLIEEQFHLYKSYFKDQVDVQDLSKQFISKKQEWDLLKTRVENYQKQQTDLIQRIFEQEKRLIEAAYNQGVQVLQDQEAQRAQQEMQKVVEKLQEDDQAFSEHLHTLNDFLDQYSSRFPVPLHLPTTQEELQALMQKIDRNISLTKRYIHNIELKKQEIDTRLAIYQEKQNQAVQAFQSQWNIKKIGFEQSILKASNQEKEQLNLYEQVLTQETKLAYGEYTQDLQQVIQQGVQAKLRSAQETRKEVEELAHRAKQTNAALIEDLIKSVKT